MKLAATTIVESMMALLVLVISFTAAMTIYLSMLQGDAFPLRTKARTLLQTVFEEIQVEQRYLDEVVQQDGLTIEKMVVPYERYQTILEHRQVYQVILKVYDPDRRLLVTEHHLIQVPYEN